MTLILGRLCTVCMARTGHTKAATYIAENAKGLQWYECDNHDEFDHDRVFHLGKRTARESVESFFNRHFPNV